jgi:hypothetical protein
VVSVCWSVVLAWVDISVRCFFYEIQDAGFKIQDVVSGCWSVVLAWVGISVSCFFDEIQDTGYCFVVLIELQNYFWNS